MFYLSVFFQLAQSPRRGAVELQQHCHLERRSLKSIPVALKIKIMISVYLNFLIN